MIPENLAIIRKHFKLTKNEFALKLRISERAYIGYERGDRKLPFEVLEILLNEFNINLNWLIANKGNMFNAPEYEEVKEDFEKQVEIILKKKGLL